MNMDMWAGFYLDLGKKGSPPPGALFRPNPGEIPTAGITRFFHWKCTRNDFLCLTAAKTQVDARAYSTTRIRSNVISEHTMITARLNTQ